MKNLLRLISYFKSVCYFRNCKSFQEDTEQQGEITDWVIHLHCQKSRIGQKINRKDKSILMDWRCHAKVDDVSG